jgi:predicted GIY-YIG superfamily endonuclease
MEVIRRKHESGREMVCDPRIDETTLRLMKIAPNFDKEEDALPHAERELNKLERDFNVYHLKPMNLMLAGIHTEPLNSATRHKSGIYAGILDSRKELFVTTAILHGSENALMQAERALKQSFPSKIFKQKLHEDSLEVMLCGDNRYDPARLLHAIHTKTRCTLPMDINAATTPSDTNPATALGLVTPKLYNPCLETVIWDDVPSKDRGTTGNAMAGYVGIQFPDLDIIRTENASTRQKLAFARMIVNHPFPSEAEAMVAAEDIKERVEARLNRGNNPHIR